MQFHRPWFIYLLSFLEGGSVMVAELAGAKLLAPYFGTSLYVWASALGVTLGGLMLGYYSGGWISRKHTANHQQLYTVLLLASLFLFLMPFTSGPVLEFCLALPLRTGSLLSLMAFLFPPLFLMGMVSPLIINVLNQSVKEAGNKAGNVYAISTLGGILATFAMGFYLIPEFGIRMPTMISGVVLAFPVCLAMLWQGRRTLPIALVVFFFLLAFVSKRDVCVGEKGCLYLSEGILGQVKVREERNPVSGRVVRSLIVNNTLQTQFDPHDPEYDFWPYTRLIPQVASKLGVPKEALLLGMGGGTMVRRLSSEGFSVDVVEIDQRIADLAKTHFGLEADKKVVVDDARHFLRKSDKVYGLIVFDVFKGESAPEHLLSRESLKEARARLQDNGALLLNFYGYLDGAYGRLARSVIHTLQQVGFSVVVLATPGPPDQRNLVFAAVPEFSKGKLENLDMVWAHNDFTIGERMDLPDSHDAILLTDDKPPLHLYAETAWQWRKLYVLHWWNPIE
jgi:spermidine synthase